MFDIRLVKIVAIIFLLIVPLAIYILFIRSDSTFSLVVDNIRSDKVYHSIMLDGKNNPKGYVRFGKFYDCLKTYKSLWNRKFPKGSGINDEYVQIFVSSNDLLFFSVRNNEAYQVRAQSIDEKGIYQDSSGLHAINCDMELIEIVDKK
jgi:hypothetical protein